MREIKFRAFHESFGMFYQENQYLTSFLRRVMDNFMVSHPKYLPCEMESMLQQYTGLKDKNGVEIYKRDVCKNDIWWDKPRIIGFNCLGTVCSIDEEGSEWSFNIDTAADIEVLGNIHQNPELLK